MSKDDFTQAELDALFNGRSMPSLRRRVSKKAMAQSDAPMLADNGDPAFIKRPEPKKHNRDKSIKVLTIFKTRPILRSVINRKDDKMATKSKTQTNYMQTTSVCLLAAGAVLGLADLLGGGLKACFVAALLVACLFLLAIDYRK